VKAYFDTTVLVAASVAGHPHYAQVLSTLLAVHNKTVTGCVSGHGLSELYAVLTHAPLTPPIYPLEVWKIISANVLPNFEIITLAPGMYRDTIESCAHHGCIGGRIYDSLHLRQASRLRPRLHLQRSPLSAARARSGRPNRRSIQFPLTGSDFLCSGGFILPFLRFFGAHQLL
jgi:predicted nucleic acid-binding protein